MIDPESAVEELTGPTVCRKVMQTELELFAEATAFASAELTASESVKYTPQYQRPRPPCLFPNEPVVGLTSQPLRSRDLRDGLGTTRDGQREADQAGTHRDHEGVAAVLVRVEHHRAARVGEGPSGQQNE